MRYASIRKMDISNGEGIGVALFVQGCDRHCYNCFNPDTWDFNGGKEWDEKSRADFMFYVSRRYVNRVSILGGEPLDERNIQTVTEILKECKDYYGDNIKIWLWTGYKFEEVRGLEAMKHIDYLVDGEYIDSQRDTKLKWRGSSNQRVIDVQKSLKSKSVVLYEI
ncbi:MAG: anaerobic ribonucleoside-triphosphate reductase activating protein [Oscillospiraceae bacterium]|nr:anaerobic ribonucleoside-triphosphate reductase activating protein [Oscillospiraceae bacterium]